MLVFWFLFHPCKYYVIYSWILQLNVCRVGRHLRKPGEPYNGQGYPSWQHHTIPLCRPEVEANSRGERTWKIFPFFWGGGVKKIMSCNFISIVYSYYNLSQLTASTTFTNTKQRSFFTTCFIHIFFNINFFCFFKKQMFIFIMRAI